MTEKTAEGMELGASREDVIDRDTFRKVVQQRQKMKAELRRLQESLAALPEDWEERLPQWLEMEQAVQEVAPAEAGEEAKQNGHKPNKENAPEGGPAPPPEQVGEPQTEPIPERIEPPEWLAKEQDYQRRIAELTLSGMVREAARELGAYDPQDVVELTKDCFIATYDEEGIRVAPGPALKGTAFYTPSEEGENGFSLERVILDFLQRKPHLVKADFKPGSGLVSRAGNSLGGGLADSGDPARNRLAERLKLQGRAK